MGNIIKNIFYEKYKGNKIETNSEDFKNNNDASLKSKIDKKISSNNSQLSKKRERSNENNNSQISEKGYKKKKILESEK